MPLILLPCAAAPAAAAAVGGGALQLLLRRAAAAVLPLCVVAAPQRGTRTQHRCEAPQAAAASGAGRSRARALGGVSFGCSVCSRKTHWLKKTARESRLWNIKTIISIRARLGADAVWLTAVRPGWRRRRRRRGTMNNQHATRKVLRVSGGHNQYTVRKVGVLRVMRRSNGLRMDPCAAGEGRGRIS